MSATDQQVNSTETGVIGHYFGFFNGVSKEHYEKIVATAPFDKCNLLVLAFVHAVEKNGAYLAEFTNWRDNGYQLDPSDTDEDRVRLIVETARKANPSLRILISLGWGTNDAGNAASTPAPFADSVCALVEEHSLDGFDIDFESTSVEADAMLQLAEHLRRGLDEVAPKRPMTMTIAPAQTDGLDKSVLDAFSYTMPQTYDHGGNGTTADWYEEQLGSYARIVYGLNSEGYVGQSDDPKKFADLAKHNDAAGIFAWRLDNDSVDGQGFPTFATGIEMWKLMQRAGTPA